MIRPKIAVACRRYAKASATNKATSGPDGENVLEWRWLAAIGTDSRKAFMHARTLYDKLWDSHVVREEGDGTALMYVDRHLVHEVTSPQAYEGLRMAGRKPWRVESIVATADHNTPTTHWDEGIRDPDLAHAGRDARRQHPRVRREGLFPVSRPAPGHRPRDRARERRDAAGHDGRLRRFAHEHARRVRGARVRHRHVRGRARAGHAVPAARRSRRRC